MPRGCPRPVNALFESRLSTVDSRAAVVEGRNGARSVDWQQPIGEVGAGTVTGDSRVDGRLAQLRLNLMCGRPNLINRESDYNLRRKATTTDPRPVNALFEFQLSTVSNRPDVVERHNRARGVY